MAKASKDKKAAAGPKGLENRRARYDYHIEDTLEAGIVLVGSEVKSLFHGRGNLTDAYCLIRNGELWVLNMDVEPYDHAGAFQPERRRDRKLLMHRREIETLDRKSLEKGFALIPTRVYFKEGRAKMAVSLARGKKQFDKREQIAKDDERRELERARSQKF
jgi:SsrA-binding protein